MSIRVRTRGEKRIELFSNEEIDTIKDLKKRLCQMNPESVVLSFKGKMLNEKTPIKTLGEDLDFLVERDIYMNEMIKDDFPEDPIEYTEEESSFNEEYTFSYNNGRTSNVEWRDNYYNEDTNNYNKNTCCNFTEDTFNSINNEDTSSICSNEDQISIENYNKVLNCCKTCGKKLKEEKEYEENEYPDSFYEEFEFENERIRSSSFDRLEIKKYLCENFMVEDKKTNEKKLDRPSSNFNTAMKFIKQRIMNLYSVLKPYINKTIFIRILYLSVIILSQNYALLAVITLIRGLNLFSIMIKESKIFDRISNHYCYSALMFVVSTFSIQHKEFYKRKTN